MSQCAPVLTPGQTNRTKDKMYPNLIESGLSDHTLIKWLIKILHSKHEIQYHKYNLTVSFFPFFLLGQMLVSS